MQLKHSTTFHDAVRSRGRSHAFIATGIAAAMLFAPITPALASAEEPPAAKTAPTTVTKVADTPSLHTWWHDNATKNATAPVSDDKVRESPFYTTKVASSNDTNTLYDSFTYISVPRSGNGKVGYTEEDGAEFAADNGMTMSWSSFEYSKDAQVDVSLDTGQTIKSADDVTIRPTSDHFKKELVNDHTVRITVPYSDAGYRFSVEFTPQIVTVYNDNSGASGVLTLDKSNGASEVEQEPQNAMMVFAQPKLGGEQIREQIPDKTASNVYSPKQGAVTKDMLDNLPGNIDTLYFGPGTYWMGNAYRAQMANVRWVYLAPGAYVKGAFKFLSDKQTDFRVTGYGVLSGEQYVYEADTTDGYQHLAKGKDNCWDSCVKMLQFQSPTDGTAQTLNLQGVTVASPPYHTFVMYGNEDGNFKMTVNNYQQIGGWYWQTDGLELYKGSTMHNSFLHSNDDVVKLYHSNVTVGNNVIWKNENGPVFQWGWAPRNITNVHVSDTDIIHNRMYWKDTKTNTCVINSSSSYLDGSDTSLGSINNTVDGLTISNTNVECMVNCAVRIYAMQNTRNVLIDGLHIDEWNKVDPTGQVNLFKAFTDRNNNNQRVTIGNQTKDHEGLLLHNYTVGGQTIRKAGDNWASDELGRLDFDGDLWDNWDATGDDEPSGTVPTLSVNGIEDGGIAASRDLSVSGTTDADSVTVTVNGIDAKPSFANGRFSTTAKLDKVSNRVRVVARGANGMMNVKRYTVYAYGTQIGSLSDPTGDDNGPGSYQYPSSGAFSKGSFDMKDFNVFRDGDDIRFVTTVAGQITNPWGGTGMSTQRLNIYVHDSAAPTSDSAAEMMPGTNTFTSGAWSKVIVADGRSYDGGINSGVYEPSIKSPKYVAPIDLNVLQGDTIVVSVKAATLSGIDLSKAGYQVAMFSSAEPGESVGDTRPVYQGACAAGTPANDCTPAAQEFFFVGGLGEKTGTSPFDSATTDSNAIDVFTGAHSQAALMSLDHHQVTLPFLTLNPAQHPNDGGTSTPGQPAAGTGTDTDKPTHIAPADAAKAPGTGGARSLADTGTSSLVLALAVLALTAVGVTIGQLRRTLRSRQ